jgi:hypothetical protein
VKRGETLQNRSVSVHGKARFPDSALERVVVVLDVSRQKWFRGLLSGDNSGPTEIKRFDWGIKKEVMF